MSPLSDCLGELLHPLPRHGGHAHCSQLTVELVQGEAHALGQVAGVACVWSQRWLERLEVIHPLQRILVTHHVDLVHGHDEGQLVLVEDGAGVQHVRHEDDAGSAPHAVHHIHHDSAGELMMLPLADQVNTSICSGVSMITNSFFLLSLTSLNTWSNLVANRLRLVTMPPWTVSPPHWLVDLLW